MPGGVGWGMGRERGGHGGARKPLGFLQTLQTAYKPSYKPYKSFGFSYTPYKPLIWNPKVKPQLNGLYGLWENPIGVYGV